jgi:hypothetical protein
MRECTLDLGCAYVDRHAAQARRIAGAESAFLLDQAGA